MAKPLRVVITIGHTQILLPDDTGAATVVKTLSRGMQCFNWSNRVQIEAKSEIAVSLSYIPASTPITDEHDRPIAEAVRPTRRKLMPQHVPQLPHRSERSLL